MEIPKKVKKTKKSPAKPGGKALERLRQFEQERGLEPAEVIPPETPAPPKKQPKKTKKPPGK